MRKLGISIYPARSSLTENLEYIEKAGKLGYKRVFTCLLSVKADLGYYKKILEPLIERAHAFDMEFSVDMNPTVFNNLGVTVHNLSSLDELGIDTIRLDGAFSRWENIKLTNNPFGLMIEFNTDQYSDVLGYIHEGANKHQMQLCHNFYPQPFTGLSQRTFDNFNRYYQPTGLLNAAFVSSQADSTFGPWAVFDGLPTLEAHRAQDISSQARHLIASQAIDTIIIGNAFATDQELLQLSKVNLNITSLKVNLEPDATEAEKRALYDVSHQSRVDASEYFVRSSVARGLYRDVSIQPRIYTQGVFTRGDIVIINDNLDHYRGEVELILRDTPNKGYQNLIGKISDLDLLILDEIEKAPGRSFIFCKA